MTYFANWNKRLEAAREKFAADGIVWFRRPQFYKPEHRDVEPKWHLFADRLPPDREKEEYSHTWKSKCGYTHKFYELLEDLPKLKTGREQPKKVDRCLRCVEVLKKEKSDAVQR